MKNSKTKSSLFKNIDFSLNSINWGGKLKDIPKPHVYYYPSSGKKCPVESNITSFAMVGGQHFYATLSEDRNMVWNSKEKCWQCTWDGTGRKSFIRNFNTIKEAKKFIKDTFKKEFDRNFYILVDINRKLI